MIRKINIDDLENLSNLHVKIFDKSYFSVYFSTPDLKKYFAKLIELNKYSYVFEYENRVVGYLIGGHKTQFAVDEFMRENRFKIIYYIAINPKFIFISLKKIIKKTLSNNLKSSADLRLFLIGVDPSEGKKGIGANLIKKFEEDIRADGYKLYGLYVRTNNVDAINFYNKIGFVNEFKNFDLFSFLKILN